MEEQFKKTKYYSYLLNSMEEMERDRTEFNSHIIELLNQATDELGIVLKCHLILEYYMDMFLKTAYPTISQWDKTRFTFSQKLELLNSDKTTLQFHYQAIKCLNTIRNKFSHKLSYSLVENDCLPIKSALEPWYTALQKPMPNDLPKLIEEFTVWICGNINIIITAINRHSKDFGLPGYLLWLKEMQEEEKPKA